MIKPFVCAGVAAACLVTPVFAQGYAHDARKPQMARPAYQPMAGGRHGMGPGMQTNRPSAFRAMAGGHRGMGPGPQMGRPGYQPTAFARQGMGYGGRNSGYGYAARPARQSYGGTYGQGYGRRSFGFGGGGYGSAGYGYTGGNYGYGSGSGYGSTNVGAGGYATVGQGGGYGYGAYTTQSCCAAQPAPVVTTAYLPVLTYRPIKVIYTPQTPPYYNTPAHYVAY